MRLAAMRCGALLGKIQLVLLLLSGLLLYRKALRGYFLGDDFGYIQLYARTLLRDFGSLFVQDWSQGIWGFDLQELRPVLAFTYWLDYRMWGTRAFGYHLMNLALYLLGVVGLFYLARETFLLLQGAKATERNQRPNAAAWSAWVVALLFLVHPAHTEAVAWISGRSDLLAAAAYFWGFCFLVRYWNDGRMGFFLCGVFVFLLGLFAKENVVTLPLTFVLYALLLGGAGQRWRRLAAVSAAASVAVPVWMGLRKEAFGSAVRYEGTAQFAEFAQRLPFYAGQIVGFDSPWALGILAGCAAACGAVAARRRDLLGRSLLFWGMLWPGVQLLPLIVVGYSSSRHVFLASEGPLLVLAMSAAAFSRGRRAIWFSVLAICATLGIVYAVVTARQIGEWEKAGEYSRSLSAALEQSDLGADDVVVVASHPPIQGVWFWNWSLPFASQPPFVRSPARLVEAPEWYCCPDWVERKLPIVEDIVAGRVRRILRAELEPSGTRFRMRAVKTVPERGLLDTLTKEKLERWIAAVQGAPAVSQP